MIDGGKIRQSVRNNVRVVGVAQLATVVMVQRYMMVCLP